MYILVKAIGVKKLQGARYAAFDANAVPVSELFTTYRKAYFTLSNVFLSNPVDIEMSSLREKYSTFAGTFSDLLVDLGNTALTQVTVAPVLAPKYAVYSDAFRAGYKVQAMNILTSISASMPGSSKTSLRISRPNPPTNMETFHKNCIVSINGFFHKTVFDGTYVYVVDGNKSKIKSRQNQMGFLSFLDIGEIETIAIKPSMMFKQSESSSYKNKVYLKLGKDITNKTVILVLGGYLMFVDNKALKQSGNDIFVVDINSIPFVERFFEAMPYLDYKALDLPVNKMANSAVDIDELLSDKTLTSYFTMPQSFFCIINTPEIFTNRIAVRSSNLPGMFTGYQEPMYPLVVANGRVAEYWKTYEDGQWAMNVHNSYLHNKVFSTIPVDDMQVVTISNTPATRVRSSSGYLLEIGKDF